MNVRAHFPFRFVCLIFVSTAFLLVVTTQSCLAQPVGDQRQDIQKMQQQLAALQLKIAAIDQTDSKSNQFDNDRVKSIGSHRSRREPEPVVDESLQIRLYDLSDIFAVAPHYPAVLPNDLANSGTMFQTRRGRMMSSGGQGGGFGGGGALGGSGSGGVFSVPANPIQPPVPKQEAEAMSLRSAQVSMTQLVSAIQKTVEPAMWNRTRDKATIQFLGNTLLITATDEMHLRINNLLNLFREHWGKLRTVSVQTYWIRAAAGQAAELLDSESQASIGAGVVDREKWKTFLAQAKSDKRFAYSATLTGHNNQTLHALSGRQRQLTIDAIPFESTKVHIRTEDDENPFDESMDDENDEELNYFSRSKQIVGFSPVRQSFHHGAAIQITPLATRGGNFVILDLHAKVNELTKPNENEEATSKQSIFVHLPGGQKAEVALDNAEYISYRLNTTVRCPKEQVVLAGSMTYDANADSDQPDLYLFVKVAIHTIKEDKSDWNPGKEEAAEN